MERKKTSIKSTNPVVIGQRVDSAKVQRVKELRRQMTPAEKRLWQHLRTNHLDGFHFRRQQIIDGFIVDFYCHAARLVIEVDGGIHNQQIEYDQERDQILAGRDLLILRFTNREIHQEIENVLGQIVKVCHERTERPKPTET